MKHAWHAVALGWVFSATLVGAPVSDPVDRIERRLRDLSRRLDLAREAAAKAAASVPRIDLDTVAKAAAESFLPWTVSGASRPSIAAQLDGKAMKAVVTLAPSRPFPSAPPGEMVPVDKMRAFLGEIQRGFLAMKGAAQALAGTLVDNEAYRSASESARRDQQIRYQSGLEAIRQDPALRSVFLAPELIGAAEEFRIALVLRANPELERNPAWNRTRADVRAYRARLWAGLRSALFGTFAHAASGHEEESFLDIDDSGTRPPRLKESAGFQKEAVERLVESAEKSSALYAILEHDFALAAQRSETAKQKVVELEKELERLSHEAEIAAHNRDDASVPAFPGGSGASAGGGEKRASDLEPAKIPSLGALTPLRFPDAPTNVELDSGKFAYASVGAGGILSGEIAVRSIVPPVLSTIQRAPAQSSRPQRFAYSRAGKAGSLVPPATPPQPAMPLAVTSTGGNGLAPNAPPSGTGGGGVGISGAAGGSGSGGFDASALGQGPGAPLVAGEKFDFAVTVGYGASSEGFSSVASDSPSSASPISTKNEILIGRGPASKVEKKPSAPAAPGMMRFVGWLRDLCADDEIHELAGVCSRHSRVAGRPPKN